MKNKQMHPRNIYRDKPNFKELCVQYPELRQHASQDLSGKIHLNFKDPKCLRALTRALCHRDFKLEVTIPENHLVPTLPLRLNYLLWIEDLLKLDKSKSKEICGIDIGTGASCIYPLLGCRQNGWKFVGTEVNEESFSHAIKNVEQNEMTDSITVVKTNPDDRLMKVVDSRETTFDFCMCNPPFFGETVEELDSEPRVPPTNPGCLSEKVATGGESAFVEKIIEDSLMLKGRIRIYTSMLGKTSSFSELKEKLSKLMPPIASIAVTKLCQGKTVRWAIAWTFVDEIDLNNAACAFQKKTKPLTVTIPSPLKDGCFTPHLLMVQLLEQEFRKLELKYTKTENYKKSCNYSIVAKQNTWIHQRRRRRAMLKQLSSPQNDEKDQHTDTTQKRALDSGETAEPPAKQAKLDDVTLNGKVQEDVHSSSPGALEESVQPTPVQIREQVNGGSHDANPNLAVASTSIDSLGEHEMKDADKDVALECSLRLSRKHGNTILEMNFITGSCGCDGMHQLSQYLKNILTRHTNPL